MDALQAALASVSGLRVAEQILMCGGRPLEAAQPLSAYQLPQVCGMTKLWFDPAIWCVQSWGVPQTGHEYSGADPKRMQLC